MTTDVKCRTPIYEAILRVRPAQAADVLKKLLFIRRQPVAAHRGLTFFVDPVSVFGLSMLQRGIYEPEMTRLFDLLVRPEDTVLDIGANEGYFSILAASLARDGRVYAFEPQTRLQPIIQKNLRLNDLQGVTLCPIALTDRDGEVRLYLRPSTNNGASSVFRYWKIGSRQELVHTVTLDRWCKENLVGRARLMKVDCEGSEGLVVSGASQVFSEHRVDFAVIEYHPAICGANVCAAAHLALINSGYNLSRVSGRCVYHLPGLDDELAPMGEIQKDRSWDD